MRDTAMHEMTDEDRESHKYASYCVIITPIYLPVPKLQHRKLKAAKLETTGPVPFARRSVLCSLESRSILGLSVEIRRIWLASASAAMICMLL